MIEADSRPTYCDYCRKYPWQLSCPETTLHLFPVVGILTAIYQIRKTNREIQDYVNAPPSNNDKALQTVAQENGMVNIPLTPKISTPLLARNRLLQAKKSNCYLTIQINLALCLIIFLTIGLLKANRTT